MPHARAVADRFLDALHDVLGGLASLPAAKVHVLAHDHLVEIAGGDPAQLPHVLVAAVSGGGDDGHTEVGRPRGGAGLGGGWRRRGHALDEVTHGPEAVRVVCVVDEHLDAVQLEQIQPARRLVDRGGERP